MGLPGTVSTSSRYARDEGIVLKKRDFSEMDTIVTLFARRRGKFQAIAKGARKLGNRFGASLDLFCVCDFFLYTASGMTNIVQTKIQRSFRDLLREWITWIGGEYVLYLVDRVLEEEKPEGKVFDRLIEVWKNMLLVRGDELKVGLLTLWFRVVLITSLGVTPCLSECISCGRSLGKEESFLSISQGGRICRYCARSGQDLLPLSPFLGVVLLYLFSHSLEALLRLRLKREEFLFFDRTVSAYLGYHTEKKIDPLFYFLEQVKGNTYNI